MSNLPPRSAAVRTDVLKKPVVLEDAPRGVIEKLAEGIYQSVLRITAKKGTVRANHYHKRDSHLCYLASGKLEYVWRDATKPEDPLERVVITPGQLFFSPPMVAHAMVFLADSEFYCFTTSPRRTQDDYEEDIVRVNLVPLSA